VQIKSPSLTAISHTLKKLIPMTANTVMNRALMKRMLRVAFVDENMPDTTNCSGE